MLHKPFKIFKDDTWERPGESVGITMMNQNNTAAAIAAIEKISAQAIEAIQAILTAATTAPAETTEATTTTTAATDAENKSHLDRFLDSWSKAPTAGELAKDMIKQDPCDPMPADPTEIIVIDDDDKVIAVGTTETTTNETVGDLPCPHDAAETAAEDADDPATPSEEILDKIIADISALFYIAEYSLYNEAEKIGHDNSPYSPKDNTVGDIGDYKIFISKEIIKSADHVEGSFRMIIKDKVIVNPICDYDVRIIDNHIKVFSSENTVRVEKMKENHKLLKFLEVVDDTCYLVKDKYISD